MGDSGTEEICRDDFDSNEEYNTYIQIIEDMGGACFDGNYTIKPMEPGNYTIK